MTRVLVTGASGFVGRSLCGRLAKSGLDVRAVMRRILPDVAEEQVVVEDLASCTSWDEVLQGVDVIVHLASRVHVMQDGFIDSHAEFRRVNVDGTEKLACAAAARGVRRFIFVSSIKVNGECTTNNAPFREMDEPAPQDHYAMSKWEAEQALWKVSAETGMEVVILRPPLVYGPNVKANFLRLLRWLAQGVPLPLASVRNRRSMIYLGNLVDAIVTCVDHPRVAGNTYLLSDGDDVSTPELMRHMANALGKSSRLWPLPEFGLKALGALSGKAADMDRLLGSLQVDSSRFRHDTGWVPPFTLMQGIKETVDWYQGVVGR